MAIHSTHALLACMFASSCGGPHETAPSTNLTPRATMEASAIDSSTPNPTTSASAAPATSAMRPPMTVAELIALAPKSGSFVVDGFIVADPPPPCPPCPPNVNCTPCPQPHAFFLADADTNDIVDRKTSVPVTVPPYPMRPPFHSRVRVRVTASGPHGEMIIECGGIPMPSATSPVPRSTPFLDPGSLETWPCK
jgi:hypothetical protein